MGVTRKYFHDSGICHAAALVVENQSGLVRAYVGSPDFFNETYQGQVDGVQAPRSTGSILKPFLYALAMDDGLITTRTQLMDVPTQYGTFAPANADEHFGGLVRASDALVQSLNVPAVRLLNAFGIHSFYTFLENSGMHTLFRGANGYGLPLVLGGCEATLWDLATLYRGLANGGRFSPISLQKPYGDSEAGNPLISPGAAWLTLEILSQVNRPGASHYWHMFSGERPVAWKTGTSYGRRDAWAIGVSPDWTVAIWCGNFDGSGNPALGGAETAGPLLFDIVRILPPVSNHRWFPKPATGLRVVSICSETGYPAGPNCPHQIQLAVPRDTRFKKTCPWHVATEVNDDGTQSVCSRCWQAGHHHMEFRLTYPPDVAQLMRERGIHLDTIPPHRSGCPALGKADALTIVYPDNGTIITLPRDYGGILQPLNCRAATARPDNRLYWYLDGSYLGMTLSSHQITIQPTAGEHTLTIVDQSGNRTRCSFKITR